MLNNLAAYSTNGILSNVISWPFNFNSSDVLQESPEKIYNNLALNSMQRNENVMKRWNSVPKFEKYNEVVENSNNLVHSKTSVKLSEMNVVENIENNTEVSIEILKNRLVLDQHLLTDTLSHTRWSIPTDKHKRFQRYSPEGSETTGSQWSPPTTTQPSPNDSSKTEKNDFDNKTSENGQHTKLSAAAYQIKNFLAPNYNSRNDEFKKLFKMPDYEKFITAYSCAFQREILCQGRMYISQNWICFYANIFRWETIIAVQFKDIKHIKKRKTAKVIPNAIEVTTKNGEKLFFTSFTARGKTYLLLTKMLHLATIDQTVQPEDIWTWIRNGYDANNSGSQDEGDPNDAANMISVNNSPRLAVSDNHKTAKNENNGENSFDKFKHSCQNENVEEDGSNQEQSTSKRNRNPSLMLNIPSVLPDDYSDNSSETDHEMPCPCDNHNGKEYLNETFPLSVDQMFLLLFTDNPFYRKLQTSRKNTNHVLHDWEEDKSSGGKTREITYTAALNYALGPKSCDVIDNQVCTEASKSGQVYVIHSVCHQIGIPYGDTFDIRNTYCITRVTSNSCRLKGHGGTLYRKSCWGFVKNLIEKNAEIGLSAYYTDLLKHLRTECSQVNLHKKDSSTQRNLSEKVAFVKENKKKRTKRSKAKTPVSFSTPRNQSFPEFEEIASNSHLKFLTKAILMILIAMLILNAALFYKLWYFESESERISLEANIKELNGFVEKSHLSSAQEWFTSLKTEGCDRKDVSKKFAQTVSSIIQIEKSLISLKQYIINIQNDIRNYDAPKT